MQIGSIKLDAPLALAPMAGVTDLPFRVLCREFGCGMTVSEMVSAKGLLYKNQKTFNLLQIADAERPTAIQLFGSVPGELARAAQVVEEVGADFVDFNMGCPVPKVVNNGEGSALMKTPELAYAILAAMVAAVQIPVTVKFRTGWDENQLNAVEIAKLAEQAGVAAVAVHGRTRNQFYSGTADWQTIAAVKAAVQIPVFGNGDIFKPEDGLRMLKETGCDGVMVGRGADGNPWLFQQLRAAIDGKACPQVSIAERFALLLRHGRMLVQYKGERVAIKEMRTHASAYIKGLPQAAEYRGYLHQIHTYADLLRVLQDYSAFLGLPAGKLE